MVLAPRGIAPSAPAKGSFPLDHYGDCQKTMKVYLRCIAEAKGDVSHCKQLSKAYLQCRMDNNLMAKEDLSELGFREDEKPPKKPVPDADVKTKTKESEGFVPGRFRRDHK